MRTSMWARQAGWVLFTAAWITVVVLGAGKDIAWAANVVRFWLWITAPLVLFTIFSEDVVRQAARGSRAVPVGLSMGVDIGTVLFLAAQGWFFHAVLVSFWVVATMRVVEHSGEVTP